MTDQQEIFDTFFDDLLVDSVSIPTKKDDEDEEERKRKEAERLKEIQEEIEAQPTFDEQPVKEEEETEVISEEEIIKTPVSKTEQQMFDSFMEEVEAPKEEDEKELSYTRRVKYGAAQEPLIVGSTARLIKAGFQAAVSDETFSEAAQRIEKERQEEILQDFPEFRGREEDLAVLSGRMGVAVADPVTFFIPWVKIAKAGKVASVATGAAVATGDVALREKALYGEVSPTSIALAAGLGATSTVMGDLIARRVMTSKNAKVNHMNEKGDMVSTPLEDVTPPVVSKLTKEQQKEFGDIGEEVYVESLETLQSFSDNINTLGLKYTERDVIRNASKEIQDKLNTQSAINLTKQEQKKLTRELYDYKQQIQTIQKEIDTLTLVKQPENMAIVGVSSFVKAYQKGLLEGEVGENLIRAMVHEIVRPLFGATAGGVVGVYTSDDYDDTGVTNAMIAGAFFGAFSKRLENVKSGIKKSARNIALKESEKIFKSKFRSVAKRFFAGTHAAKLQAGNPIMQKFGRDTVKIQGASLDPDDIIGESVEEVMFEMQDKYRNSLFKSVGNASELDIMAAGRIVQQKGMPQKAKYSFLEDGDLANSNAVRLANRIISVNNQFKDEVRKTGLQFNEVDSYGLTQILDSKYLEKLGGRDESINLVAEMFKLQHKNNVGKVVLGYSKSPLKELTDEQAITKATKYIDGSDSLRRQSIMDIEKLEKNTTAFIKNNKEAISKDETLIQSARFFENNRVIFDQEARALGKKLFIQDPITTNLELFKNTVPVAAFSKRFGPKGQGIDDIARDLKKYYNQYGDLKSNLSLQKLYKQDLKDIGETVNAIFGVHQVKHEPQENARLIVLAFQTILATTKLTKVALPSLGDLVQTMQNSGFKSSYNSFVRQFKDTKNTLPSREGLGLRSEQINEGIFGRAFTKGRQYDGEIDRFIKESTIDPTGRTTRGLINFQRKFFEVVQLGRVTRFAREFAFDTGTFRAFTLGKELQTKGKLKTSKRRELSAMGLTPEASKYLGKFKSMDDAFNDVTGKQLLLRAGRRTADRDALIPQIGNRRLFSQSKSPWVKFMGSFLSWAQAKSSQTNALLRRIEDGDGKLAAMMLGSLSIYTTIRQLQVALNPNEKYREEFNLGPDEIFKDTQSLIETLADAQQFSGQMMPWYVDKIVQTGKFSYGSPVESLYPVVGLASDFYEALIKDMIFNQKFRTGAVKIGETIIPGAKELTRREGVGKFFGLDDSIYEEAKVADKPDTGPRITFQDGGPFEGKELSKDYPVSSVAQNPSNRKDVMGTHSYSVQANQEPINPFTNKPYTDIYYNQVK
jgi:hypothetical protein